MKLVEEYIEKINKYITEYGSKTVLLMQVGSFYEIYSINNSENILYKIIYDISEITGLSVVEKSICVGKETILAAGFRDYSIDKWLPKMQINGYTCVVYSQIDIPGKGITRNLTGIYTPGTYISTENDQTEKNNNNMCIWIEKIKNKLMVGISNIDVISGKSSLYEYNTEYKEVPTIYDDIERYVSVYNPIEIIIISNLSISLINSITNYTNMSSSHVNIINTNDADNVKLEIVKKCEQQRYINAMFVKYFNIVDINVYMERLKYCEIAKQSFCYLLTYLNGLNPLLIDTICEPEIDNLTDRLLLENHSSNQLNIISNNPNKMSSILNLTNNTVTCMGKRRYREILLNPETNIENLNKCYDITENILIDNKFIAIRDYLKKIHDIEKFTRLIILNKLPIKNICNISFDLTTINDISDYVCKYEWLNHLSSNEIKITSTNINKFITNAIDIEKCRNMYVIDENIFKKGVYEDLDEIDDEYHNTIDILNCIVTELDNSMNNKLDPKKKTNYIKLVQTEKLGFTIQTTKSRVSTLESIMSKNKLLEWSYISSKYSNKKMFKSTSVMSVQKYNNNYHIVSDDINKIIRNNLTLKSKLKDILQQKYSDYLSRFKIFSNDLYKISSYIVELDLIQNRGYVANKYNYCKPVIKQKNESFLNIKSLRHPIIEQINEEELYVANDIKLNSKNNILLFGTNAVGKTSLIKAIGISVILAQSGMYVPAESFEYMPYNSIYTRILNCDNLFKGLSTFTLEMSEMSVILKYANKNSLILGDELCSGTEIPSAMSIFIAGLQNLIKKHSSFIFATHFHELLEFDEVNEMKTLKYKHMSIKYDYKNKCIIYDRKLKDGSGEKIYGLEVCKSLHLPESFMIDAHKILNKYYNKDILSYDHSRYNSKKIKGKCEMCKKNEGIHVHHLLYQKDAVNNFIKEEINSSINKNHVANLLNICDRCHEIVHKKDVRMIKQKTTNGNILTSIS
tara:strand:+ start:4046 stop:6955 length:2910 start_codon:yes stop_codon:yes gene_type:complete